MTEQMTNAADAETGVTDADVETGLSGNAAAGMPGTRAGDWRDQLPEDIRGAKSFEKYKDVAALANAYLSAEKFISGKHLPMPQTDADKAEIFKALGVPETPEGYERTLPEGITADWMAENIDENWENQAVQTFHALNLTPEQAKGVRDMIIKGAYDAKMNEAQASDRFIQSQNEALKKEWGSAYSARSAAANQVIKEADDGQFAAFLKETGLNNHPQMIRFLGNLGVQVLEEDGLNNTGKEAARTAQQVQADIDAVNAHPAYVDDTHPQHAFYVQKMTDLFNEKFDH